LSSNLISGGPIQVLPKLPVWNEERELVFIFVPGALYSKWNSRDGRGEQIDAPAAWNKSVLLLDIHFMLQKIRCELAVTKAPKSLDIFLQVFWDVGRCLSAANT
jgi:hypothetical protein